MEIFKSNGNVTKREMKDFSSEVSVGLLGLRELDDEEKYWRCKIIYSALESVLFSPKTDPRLSPEMLHYLRRVFVEEANPDFTSEAPPPPPLPEDTQQLLEGLVATEIRNMVKAVVSANADLLQNSEKEEWLRRLSSSENPLQEVLRVIEAQNQAEAVAEDVISECKVIRASELAQVTESITKVSRGLESIAEMVAMQKQPDAVHAKLERLSSRSTTLAAAAESVKKEKLILENSAELDELTEELTLKMASAVESVQRENDQLLKFLEEYDNLDQERKDLVSKLKGTEEAIERQRWILDKMHNYSNTQEDDSLHFDDLE